MAQLLRVLLLTNLLASVAITMIIIIYKIMIIIVLIVGTFYNFHDTLIAFLIIKWLYSNTLNKYGTRKYWLLGVVPDSVIMESCGRQGNLIELFTNQRGNAGMVCASESEKARPLFGFYESGDPYVFPPPPRNFNNLLTLHYSRCVSNKILKRRTLGCIYVVYRTVSSKSLYITYLWRSWH